MFLFPLLAHDLDTIHIWIKWILLTTERSIGKHEDLNMVHYSFFLFTPQVVLIFWSYAKWNTTIFASSTPSRWESDACNVHWILCLPWAYSCIICAEESGGPDGWSLWNWTRGALHIFVSPSLSSVSLLSAVAIPLVTFHCILFRKLYGDQARFFEMELKPRIKHTKTGTLSMVNNGNDMHGSQVRILSKVRLLVKSVKSYFVFGTFGMASSNQK